MTIKEIQKRSCEIAKSRGWHDPDPGLHKRLLNIYGEISEAVEADRDNRYADIHDVRLFNNKVKLGDMDGAFFESKIKDSFWDEIADIIIRICELAEIKGVDITPFIDAKMAYNSHRDHRHGGKKY